MSLASQITALATRIAQDIKLRGVPSGGTAGQVLTKTSAADYNSAWANAAGAATLMFQPQPQVGDWVGMWTTNNNQSTMLPDGQCDFAAMPFMPGTYDQARIRVNTAGSAGAKIRMAVYSDSGGKPGTLIAQTPALAAETASQLIVGTLSTSLVITQPTLLWVAAVSQGGASTRPNLQIFNGYMAQPLSMRIDLNDDWYTNPWGPRASGITGDFPTTVTTVRGNYQTSVHKLFFRRSA